MKKVVFVDRDGTIVREPRDRQIDSLEKLEFVPGIVAGLKLLVDSGYTLVVVSNQDGLGSTRYPQDTFRAVQAKIIRLLGGEGIRFDRIFICPHTPGDGCACRKPKTRLVDAYMKKNAINPLCSFVLGDRTTDMEFARNLGVRPVRLTPKSDPTAEYATADALEACRFIARSARTAGRHRKTDETDITARVFLEGTGRYEISTGIGFFDHMLAQLARHSRMDIVLQVRGDLQVDEHHTVEDTGIVLGESVREALGEKRGIRRYGFIAPLDEALAEVAIDLSGRRYLSYRCTFTRERVGELPTELVEEFFRAFADGLRATLHIRCRGKNDHHKIEAIFKSVAQALRSAILIDDRTRTLVPTTKGML